MPIADWCMSGMQVRHFKLLEYLSTQGEGIHDLAEYYAHDQARTTEAFEDVQHLGHAGLVDPVLSMGGLDGVSASLPPSGKQFVAEVRSARLGRADRQWALRGALLDWLYDQEAVGASQSRTWEAFDLDMRSLYYGESFRAGERDRAAAWLKRHGLIDGIEVAEAEGPVRAHVTDEGELCAERFNCDVKAYVESKEAPSMGTTTWNVTGKQVQIATGDGAEQTINLGPTLEQIKLGLQGVAELVRLLDPDVDSQARSQTLAAAAIEDLESEQPTGEPAQRFLEWVKDAVQRGGTDAVVAAVMAMSSGILEDVHRVVTALGS